VTGSQIKDGIFVFQSSFSKGLIFLGIAVANFLAMFLAKGKANVALGVFGFVAAALVFCVDYSWCQCRYLGTAFNRIFQFYNVPEYFCFRSERP